MSCPNGWRPTPHFLRPPCQLAQLDGPRFSTSWCPWSCPAEEKSRKGASRGPGRGRVRSSSRTATERTRDVQHLVSSSFRCNHQPWLLLEFTAAPFQPAHRTKSLQAPYTDGIRAITLSAGCVWVEVSGSPDICPCENNPARKSHFRLNTLLPYNEHSPGQWHYIQRYQQQHRISRP